MLCYSNNFPKWLSFAFRITMGLGNAERHRQKKGILQKKQPGFENNPLFEPRQRFFETCTETSFSHQFSKSWNKLTLTPQNQQPSERTETHTKTAHMPYHKHYPSLRKTPSPWRFVTGLQFQLNYWLHFGSALPHYLSAQPPSCWDMQGEVAPLFHQQQGHIPLRASCSTPWFLWTLSPGCSSADPYNPSAGRAPKIHHSLGIFIPYSWGSPRCLLCGVSCFRPFKRLTCCFQGLVLEEWKNQS